MPHQCDSEPAYSSQLQCGAAPAAGTEVGTVAGSEADTEAGTAVCTAAEVEVEVEADVEAGSEAVAWPLRGTGWKRPRRRWKSPGQCG